MAIQYYNPNRPQEDLYRFTMSQIMNMAILTAQQKARQREAEIGRTHAEKLQMQLAGFQTTAPTDKTTTTPSGGKRRVPAEAVQPDVTMGEGEETRKYYYKGFKPRILGTLAGGAQVVETGPGQMHIVKPTVPKAPTTRQVKRGDDVVTEEYNLTTGKWTEVGRGKRYKPTTIINMPAAAERERLASGSAALEGLENLRNLFNDNYVGPLTGRVGQIKDIFGKNPQAQSQFYAASAAFRNAIIKEITGAQMGEKEADRIREQIPEPDDPPTVWKAKWEQSIRNVQVLQKKRIEIMKKSGLKVPELERTRGVNPNDPLGLF